MTQFLVYWLFNKPYELKEKELELKKANAFKKNKSDNASDSIEDGKAKKKKKKVEPQVE